MVYSEMYTNNSGITYGITSPRILRKLFFKDRQAPAILSPFAALPPVAVNTEPFGLNSIVGMSGGPIFGFRRYPNGEQRYWVVALQSWWDPETRTIYGCPVPIFARLVAEAFANDAA